MKKLIKHFTDLEAWREAHKLVLLVYKISEKFPREELYNITSQIKRAAISITNNIAEGFCRFHYKERINFYYDSRGSIGEVQNCLIVARDIKIIDEKDFELIWKQTEKTYAIINGLIKGTEIRIGKKF